VGERFVKAGAHDRKALWREQILQLRLFQDVRRMLEHEAALPRANVLALIHEKMPHESYDRVFDTLVQWARFGDLFAYDEGSERLTLQ